MALGNIFSLSCPPDERSPENGRLFDLGVRPEQDDCLRVAEHSTPIGVQQEGLSECAGRRHKYRLYVPAVKNVSPAGAELHGGLKLTQEVVAIEVGPAVHEDAILGIEFPYRKASPVVVNKDFARLVAGPQEGDRLLGKLFRLTGILVAGKTVPLHQRKDCHQDDYGPVEKGPEPRTARMLVPDRVGR